MASLGPNEPLSSLVEQLASDAQMQRRAKQLAAHGYTDWRRGGADGNSFYRAVGFGFLERLVTTTDPKDRASRAAAVLEHMAGLTFEGQAAEAGDHAALVQRLRRLRDGGGWEEPSARDAEMTALGLLYRSLSAPGGALERALITALRRVTAQYLVEHADDPKVNQGLTFHAECVTQGYASVEEYCDRAVLPHGAEGRGACQQALAAVLGVGLRVADLDGDSYGDVELRDFGLDGPPLIHVQHRGGHYDLVYLPEEHTRRRPKNCVPSLGDDDCFPVTGAGKPPTFGEEAFGECAVVQPLPVLEVDSPPRGSGRRFGPGPCF